MRVYRVWLAINDGRVLALDVRANTRATAAQRALVKALHLRPPARVASVLRIRFLPEEERSS